MEMDQSKEFDKILEELGPRGKFQMRIFWLLCIPCSMSSVFICFNHIFVSAVPPHWCDISHLTTNPEISYEEIKKRYIPLHTYADGREELSKCFIYNSTLLEQGFSNVTIRCNKWTYDKSNYDETIATKFNAICDNSWWITFATTSFVVGSLFGTAFFGWACDKWGRKFMLMPIIILNIIVSLLSAFSVNYVMYTITRCLSGVLFPAIYQVPFVLGMELLGPNDRTAGGNIMSILYALYVCVLAFTAYLTRHWFFFIMVNVIPQIALISYYWLIPESPRWLLSKNRIEEAEEIIQKIAISNKVNKRKTYLDKFKVMNLEYKDKKVDFTPIDLFLSRNICIKYIIILYNWAINALVYQGLSYYTAHLDINTFLAFSMGGLMDTIGCALSWWGMEKYGRKSMLASCMFFGGLACTSTVFFQGFKWATISLAMVGKLGCSAGFNIFYLFVAELLPTVVRSQAMSLSSFFSGIVLLIFPILVDLANEYKVLPLIIMGSLSMIGGGTALVLPETFRTPLPQTLQEAEAIPPDLYCFRRKRTHLTKPENM